MACVSLFPRRKTRAPRLGGIRWSFILSLFRRGDTFLGILVLAVACLLHLHFAQEPDDLRLGGRDVPAASSPAVASEELQQTVDSSSIPESGEPVRFLMLNAANYFVPGERSRSRYMVRSKSEAGREAVAEVIAEVRPEIVGLTEMGGACAVADLRERLAARGLDYPYYRVLVRDGEDRALAVLSRHPIVQDFSKANYGLYGNGKRKMLRGILDVTVQLADGRMFRVLGAHLKSHVGDDAAAADSLRGKEAYTLAHYVRRVMRQDAKMPLVMYGDWNDGPSASSLQVLTQGISKDSALTRLSPVDSRGEAWTLYYRAGNEYCVYDQIYVNKVLRKRMGRDFDSGVTDTPATRKASDHRAVWCELR